MTSGSSSKLTKLRELMKDRNIDAYVVPSEDAHASEYLAPCDARRAYITSFTGSAGCAVITHNEARCWTDGRYWVQAEKQLGEGWTLMKSGLPEVPTWGAWLKSASIDPTLIPQSESTTLSTSLTATPTTSSLVPISENLVDIIWSESEQKPTRPTNEIFNLSTQYTGESVESKISRIRDKLKRIGSPGIIVTSLDEIAWLFNLRGADIPYNPVFFAYAILTRDDCTLFASPKSLTDPVREYLHKNGIALLDYDQIWNSLGSWQKRLTVVKTDKVLIGMKTSWAIAKAVGEDNVEVRRSIIEESKAKKNATEIEGFRQCHIRDGVALARYFAWLEEALQQNEKWSEYDAARVLENYRKENKWFMGLSFETISSTGANAAIIHYAPPKEGSAIIDKDKMYLCDSGANRRAGTTDVTRTFHFGTPTEEEKRAFTRVLQGHIALDTVVFPQGTTGKDILARRALWSDGMDYRHGTSHGIGSFLNVHEGPQGVGQRPAYNDVPLVEGMVISNEPGYYAEGKFGIRIEGVDIIVRAETRENFGGKGWLGMERICMCPIQSSLLDISLLSPSEKDWLNEYHSEVLEKIGPMLREVGDERAIGWLERQCTAI
uniref:Xaa-Pro aminopeptidase n=1 Tax=Kwoniella bestiolae CBS 10118 TaxID=1296100 RepID=A0A1B9G8L7_9TREE|nr:xaa-Pro aminopeptidase [Kwoniella bestiolae CBS 10118]OCF27362.1 xaa-Pro aminopeptidase [Kwoniella bestiolae CBS 10118]